jgi:Electron transfer DM13
MKRFLIGIAAGVVGGTLFGFALGIFVYPFWFLRDTAMERLADSEARTEVARGMFTHVNRADPVHWGKGDVSVFQDATGDAVVFLHDTFEVGPGPRFHVYLVDRPDVDSKAAFLASRRVDLGRLHAFTGSQVYPVPRGPAPADYKSVVIWCKEFGVLISPATLRTALSSTGKAPAKSSHLSIAGHVPATFAPKL